MSSFGRPSAATTADPWVNRTVGGRWRILALLDDSGGMASVYLADDTRLPRKAVVKIPKAAHHNVEFAQRFAREAHWHATVTDRNVVKILDRGEESGTPFMVLDYLPGGNLKAWCTRNASMLSEPRLHYEAWLLPVAQALDAVAAKGIVHRDVKPTNILFDADGRGYLSDFGIVKAGDERTLTGTGTFIGTLQFMSPEQCQPETKRSLDGRSDQYGLAVTVYQVLTGWQFPVEDDTAVVYAAKFGHVAMKHVRDHVPRIPAAVNAAVMRALSPDRDKRFETSVDFAEAVLAGFGAAGERRATRAVTGPAAGPQRPAPPIHGWRQAERDTARGAGRRRPIVSRGQWQRALARLRGSRGLVLGGVALAAVVGLGLLAWWSAGWFWPASGPARLEPGDVVTNSIGMKLVLIPAGEFEMGSAETKEQLRDAGFGFVDFDGFVTTDEAPVHPVRITKPFLMGEHEVTLGQFLKFYNDGYRGKLDCERDGKGGRGYDSTNEDQPFAEKPAYGPRRWGHPSQTNDHPVVNVSWNDAVAFCEWLSRKEGVKYRLPTEAEWEYACRAGTKTRFWNGNDPERVASIDNLADGAVLEKFPGFTTCKRRDGHAFTAPVGSYRANPFGLHDMHGNVSEWCHDWYKAKYPDHEVSDPRGAILGLARVIRGGSWYDPPVSCRSTYRTIKSQAGRHFTTGFRVVREVE